MTLKAIEAKLLKILFHWITGVYICFASSLNLLYENKKN